MTLSTEGPIRLIWRTEADPRRPLSRLRHVLYAPDFPRHHFSPLCEDERVGVCSWIGPRKWRAAFFTGHDSMWVQTGTARSAMTALERELDRRSVGLFGADVLSFERETQC